MDSELVSSSLPEKSGSGRYLTTSRNTYTEIFERLCPHYMAMGMTYDQYWNGEPEMAKYYLKADKIRMSKRNLELWLMGGYVYEAICDVSPILSFNAKAGAKPLEWRKEPVPLTEEEIRAKELRDAKEAYERNRNYLMELANQSKKKKQNGSR